MIKEFTNIRVFYPYGDKHLENISEEAICELEIGTGEVHCYELDAEGTVTGKEIRSVNENKLKV